MCFQRALFYLWLYQLGAFAGSRRALYREFSRKLNTKYHYCHHLILSVWLATLSVSQYASRSMQQAVGQTIILPPRYKTKPSTCFSIESQWLSQPFHRHRLSRSATNWLVALFILPDDYFEALIFFKKNKFRYFFSSLVVFPILSLA